MSDPGGGTGDFDLLYQSRYLDGVATVHALVGDLGDAQDITQEAFCSPSSSTAVAVPSASTTGGTAGHFVPAG